MQNHSFVAWNYNWIRLLLFLLLNQVATYFDFHSETSFDLFQAAFQLDSTLSKWILSFSVELLTDWCLYRTYSISGPSRTFAYWTGYFRWQVFQWQKYQNCWQHGGYQWDMWRNYQLQLWQCLLSMSPAAWLLILLYEQSFVCSKLEFDNRMAIGLVVLE